jgi:hypothetical protein
MLKLAERVSGFVQRNKTAQIRSKPKIGDDDIFRCARRLQSRGSMDYPCSSATDIPIRILKLS